MGDVALADPMPVGVAGRAHVLVADQDRELVELVAHTLRRAGLDFVVAHDGTSALELFVLVRPSVVVLDTRGLDLLEQFRAGNREAAIIILTGSTTEDAKVGALERGADDYLTKPFSHRELLARIRACLRRSQRGAAPDDAFTRRRVAVGHLLLELDQHLATNGGRPMHLTRTEFQMLHYLMVRAGTVVPMAALLQEFWRSEDIAAKNAMRVAVHRLRRKLEPSPLHPRVLETIPGVGLRLTGELAA
jgi:DNA-binding response OmpR family regulator